MEGFLNLMSSFARQCVLFQSKGETTSIDSFLKLHILYCIQRRLHTVSVRADSHIRNLHDEIRELSKLRTFQIRETIGFLSTKSGSGAASFVPNKTTREANHAVIENTGSQDNSIDQDKKTLECRSVKNNSDAAEPKHVLGSSEDCLGAVLIRQVLVSK
ncbi:hypothetical protein VNO77_19234 [Canavalia gladiata]|uniref:Uncharacterized protein n=1 Tax=Canavalia gladiata TaxID=3824 RepID=A0AAN9QIB6_CANGL